MSINVTVHNTGNPISIRKDKMILSGLENMKKSEKERRRRLRMEQVHEQWKSISKTLLEQSKQTKKDELDRLGRDDNTEMKKAYNKRVMEIHRRYQDTENIGSAHRNAAMQPNVESIRLEKEKRNKAVAKARGAEAAQRLEQCKKAVSPHTKQQDRLRKVRDLENERSCLVSQLTTKSCARNMERDETAEGNKRQPPTSTRRKVKCVVSKKSPVRKHSKSVKADSTQTKTPCASVPTEDDDLDRTLTEENACTNTGTTVRPIKSSNELKNVSDIFNQLDKENTIESDENEPRKTIPVTSSIPKKPETMGRRGAEHYQDSSSDLTSSFTTSSSSVSDDSSYFSDNANLLKQTPRYRTPASSKVSMYDHKTRQRTEYDMPTGLVEKINIKNVPNADDLAQKMMTLENKESLGLDSQKEHLKNRTNDAILREKIRRDYKALLKNLDLLSNKERKLKANQVACDPQVTAPSKSNESLAKRQKQMDRVFESILRNSRNPVGSSEIPMERPITITPRDYIHSNSTPANEWREPPYLSEQEHDVNCSEEEDEYTKKRKISELLIKIEKLKRHLLQEFGPDLPDDVFNASLRSLFNHNCQSTASACQNNRTCCATPKPTAPAPPEIQVINMSSEENIKLANKIVASQCKKFISRPPVKPTPKTSSSTMTTRDQEIQVEMEQEKPNEKAPHPIEPLVKIVTPKHVDSSTSVCSNSSASTDVVIDVSKHEVKLVPKNKKNSVKVSKSSSMLSTRSKSSVKSSVKSFAKSPAKSGKIVRRGSLKTPMKITIEQKEGSAVEVAFDPEKKEITVQPKKKKFASTQDRRASPIISGQTRSLPSSRMNSPSKKLSKSAPPSRHSSPKKSPVSRQAKSFEEHRYREQFTQVSIDSSTSINSSSSSMTTNRSFYSRYMASRRVVTKLQDTSDASTIYISPPSVAPTLVDDANETKAAILELFNMDPLELKRRAQEVSLVSSVETPTYHSMTIPSNVSSSNKVNRNLTKFMSLVHAQTLDTQMQTSSSTTQTHVKSTAQTTTRRSTTNSFRACNCRDPGCRLFHEKIEDVNRYTLKHCPEILKKYESLQQDCTERIASLTDLIEKVRNEQRGVDLSIGTSSGDTNTVAKTQTISSVPSTATSVNVNQLVKNIESIHAQLKQTLVESQKIISHKSLDSSKSPLLAVAVNARDKSSSLNWSKDTLTNDSLEVNADKTRKSYSVGTQQPSQKSPNETSKPKVLNSERVNIRLDRFRMSQDTKCTGTVTTAERQRQQNEDVVEQLSKEILEQSKSINKSVPPVDKSKESDDDLLKSSQAPVKDDIESSANVPIVAASTDNDNDNQPDNEEISNSEYVPLLAGIPKLSRKNSSSNGSRTRPPVTLISGPYRPDIGSPVHELSTIVEFDTPDTVNKSQRSTRSPLNKCRKRLPTDEAIASGLPSPTKRVEAKLSKSKPSVHVAPLPPHQSPQSLNASTKSTSKSIEKSPRKSIESPLEIKKLSTSGPNKRESSDSLHTLPDVHIEELQLSQDNGDANYLRISQISELHSIPDEEIDDMIISGLSEEAKSKSASPTQIVCPEDGQESDKGHVSSTSSRSLSNVSGVSEMTTTPSTDLNKLKYPTSPEDLEEGLKKLGLNWALATLKKTREASALGSSSSSDVTPVNTAAARLVSPLKKSHHDSTVNNLPEVSDVSSISMKHANKSTDKSVLVKGRTSTPNRLLEQNSDSNSSGTISTLDSFCSDAIHVAHDQSVEHSIPNISFK